MRELLRAKARANMLKMGITQLNKRHQRIRGSSKFALNWRKFV